MATINYAAKEISVKIVYYGPGLSGKTTNLQIIHRRIPPESKSEMVSLATETDRTLFFDFLPLDLGKIRGFSTKFQLYTVPGQVYYNATRKLVLRGVDGIVFVSDSAANKIAENLESFKNMEENLSEYGYSLETIPVVIQYNKRDLPNALPVLDLNSRINTQHFQWNEAIANKGQGVFESLKLIGKLVIDQLNQKYSSNIKKKAMSRPQVDLSIQPEQPARPQAYAPQPPAAPTMPFETTQPQTQYPFKQPQQPLPFSQFTPQNAPPQQQPNFAPQNTAPNDPRMERNYTDHNTINLEPMTAGSKGPQQTPFNIDNTNVPSQPASDFNSSLDTYYSNLMSQQTAKPNQQFPQKQQPQVPQAPHSQKQPSFTPPPSQQQYPPQQFTQPQQQFRQPPYTTPQQNPPYPQQTGFNAPPFEQAPPYRPQQPFAAGPAQPFVPQRPTNAPKDSAFSNPEFELDLTAPPQGYGQPPSRAQEYSQPDQPFGSSFNPGMNQPIPQESGDMQPDNGSGDETPLYFTSVNRDKIKKKGKKPVNPKHQTKKGFLSRFFGGNSDD